MAEKTMKELRDEIALQIFLKLNERPVFRSDPDPYHPAVGQPPRVDEALAKTLAKASFELAEIFLAARYDADKAGSRAA